jgi:arginine utilization protein RocB
MTSRARAIALDLASWPSVNGTPDETAFSGRLAAYLQSIPELKAAGVNLEAWPIAGDALGRSNVVAHLPGQGHDAIVLAGHFDVVPIDDYGTLAPLAWFPEQLAPQMIEQLRATGSNALALNDLESGAFLPGRGLLDMKSGLAAGIAAMERHAADPNRRGHMVLIATPDEEDRSVGMRAASVALTPWLQAKGLNPKLGINLDATCDNGDGSSGRTVALGCVGKLLLSAFVVGTDAHACYPLNGVNGTYLTAELIAEMEFATELGEEAGCELASPPTVLASRDLKSIYNVTTPSRVWTIWNVLTQRRTSADVLARARTISERAIARAQARMAERAGTLSNAPALAAGWNHVRVMSFAEVRSVALENDPGFEVAFAGRAAKLAADDTLDYPTRSRILTELAWDASGLEGPVIVLGFASMPYPAINWGAGPDAATLEASIAAVTSRISARHKTSVQLVRHLEVIVDMSFLGQVDAHDLRETATETPIWGSSIIWDLSAQPTPALPMVNIGPWGRDYHHWLERVDVDYAYRVLPDLVFEVAIAVLAGKNA